MTKLFILCEHAAGYGVFQVKEFEEIGMWLPQLEDAIQDLSRFNSIVQLVGFSPFKSAVSALQSINALTEGLLPDDLQQFLDITIPKSKKKDKYTLGVTEPKISAAIHEALQITCTHLGVVPEIIRGIRAHFPALVRGLTAKSSEVAHLGLGHSYSRAKIKFNVHKVDNMIIQSIALLDQLDKDVNTFAMRMREWYSYHFPELVKIVPDSYTYAKLVKFIKNRKELTDESLDSLEEITMDSGKAQAILDASRSSMGMDINTIDLGNIDSFATRVVSLSEYRKEVAGYLKSKMNDVAPNLALLIGEQVGARLISHAGSLTNLAKCPASTVQILGAEKALFRALKTRGNTPKYGLIFHSTFIGRAGPKNKGRISRYLANKCSMASRIDCFSEVPSQIFGVKLREQVEDRLKFYETGDVPKKNIDVMKEAIVEFEQHVTQVKSAEKKKKKKRKAESLETTTEAAGEPSLEPPKKKKKRKAESLETTTEEAGEPSLEPSKKKKKQKAESLETTTEEAGEPSLELPKKKKKQKAESLETTTEEAGEPSLESPKKKKKKRSSV